MTQDAADDPRVGQTLQGRYRILERLASGGMGVVYRGERVGLGRTVAIKFVWAWAAQDQQIRKRFEIEAQAMSRLTHPSCVGVIDFGVEDDSPYLVMDFARGKTLRARIREGTLSAAQALQVARQILAGLAHAHEQGITHRDIKPENIILTETSGFGAEVRILDFGLAKLKDVSTTMTSGFALGTPLYMSPEQTLGGAVDARADLYSTGVVLFELLTGRPPFVADELSEVLRMHREARVPSLAECAPDAGLSPALGAVLARALKKTPEARFQSAAEMAAALEATPEASGAATPMPSPRVERKTAVGKKVTPVAIAPTVASQPIAPSPRRSRPIAAALVGLGLAAAGGLWLVLGRGATKEPSTAAPLAAEPPRASEGGERGDAPPGLDEARALVKAGRSTAALDALRKLRAKHPDSAEVAYVLGHAYFDRMWWSDGFEAYEAAVQRNPSYRTDATLIGDVLKSLVSDRYGAVGARFIEREVGSAAVPYLEELSRSKSQNIRGRATQLLARLKRPG